MRRDGGNGGGRSDTERYTVQIEKIIEEEYGEAQGDARRLIQDVDDLYAGRWASHERCAVGYHTLDHVMEVTLATCRLMAGWNRAHPPSERFDYDSFLAGLAGALFHDAGYLKDKGDHVGTGGKLTFVHVGRSIAIAGSYLSRVGWREEQVALVKSIIDQTEFGRPVHFEGPLSRFPGKELSAIVATGDLLAQMADVDYMESLPDLFAEFKEAYETEGVEKLRARGVVVFESAQQMIDGTTGFFENFVSPRFESLGRMDRYLNYFFESSRNPYTECIVTNLYRTSVGEGMKPQRRIGELLRDFGLISADTLDQTLAEQHSSKSDGGEQEGRLRMDRLIDWIGQCSSRTLGEMLVDKGEISPSDLHWVVEERLLPSKMLEALSFKDLAFLLRVGIMLNHMRHTPRVLSQGLAALNDILTCQASSILLAEERTQSLVIVAAAGRQKADVETVSIPWDKGVAGWVYCQGRSALVDNVNYDRRFYKDVDRKFGFSTRSILAVPLIMNGTVIGVLEAINKKRGAGIFDERDLYILNIVSQQVSGSLDNFLWKFDKSQMPQ